MTTPIEATAHANETVHSAKVVHEIGEPLLQRLRHLSAVIVDDQIAALRQEAHEHDAKVIELDETIAHFENVLRKAKADRRAHFTKSLALGDLVKRLEGQA